MATIRSTSTSAPAKTATPSKPTMAPQGQTVQSSHSAQSATQPSKPSCEHVAMRAYEKWVKRGCVHGYDVQDWVEAEKEVMAEQGRSTSSSATSARR